ncbi:MULTISPECIES: NACHT domain-containing protein [unclassified Streptomyces]|uniref:NACHT domain-containing protein n=1 Tax=unclassified Streptomyces TaxID=2593676 RepID=UPI00381DB3F1
MGARYLLLMVVGVGAALALTRSFHLDLPAAVIAVLPSLAPAYLAWKAYQHDRIDALPSVEPGAMADQLARAVRKQWDDEAAIRRLNDPYPLPVAWHSADATLVETWEQLTRTARSWPGGPPGDPLGWPAGAEGLAGADGQIGDVFSHRVPTRRLVVLGEPGSGKTMLLVRLLQDLMARRPPGGPVPVLFSLASWNPSRPLKEWLGDELRRTHRGLRAPVPAAAPPGRTRNAAAALLDAGLVLPLLDGFDELPASAQARALDALNQGLSAGEPLVLASRVTAYRQALDRPHIRVRLNGAAGIHLLPLDRDHATEYLLRDTGGADAPAAARWTRVVALLGSTTPVGQALTTPLGLFLARTIYNPRPLGPALGDGVPHPDDLCDPARFPTREALDAHLFDAFVPASYNSRHPRPPRWSASQARRAFAVLARHQESHRHGSPDLAWWRLPEVIPTVRRRLLLGAALGCSTALLSGLAVGLSVMYAAGIVSGLVVGCATGIAAAILARTAPAPSTHLRWSSGSLKAGLRAGLRGGLTTGVAIGVVAALVFGGANLLLEGPRAALTIGPASGVVFGLLGGGLFGTVLGAAAAFTAETYDLTAMVGPAALLRQDRRTPLVVGAGSALALSATVGPMLGILLALAVALVVGLVGTAWGRFALARTYLAARGDVPRDLMAFLADAHEHRGVLRQVGVVYQFRHLELQRHLARRDDEPG